MVTMPKRQLNHNFIDKKIVPWLDLHFPADSKFNGRVVISYRRKDSGGIYNLMRADISKVSEFVPQMHISRNVDYYITANSICGVRRVTEDVFGLHNIVIDIDCHAEAVNATEILSAFIWRCSRDLWTSDECPAPNSIVFSGRGIQLWWAIEPASVKIQYWYKRMQSWLFDALQGVLDDNPEQFEDLSMDRSASIKLAGLFRMPYTYNTKTGRKGTVQILRKERYVLRDMLESFVPAEYNPNKGKHAEKPSWASLEAADVPEQEYIPLASRDAEVMRGGSSAMAARVQQLVRLRAMRNASMGQEMRDRFCFTVYCALLGDHSQDEAWGRLLAFNEGFKEPLSHSALKQMMASATERKYRLTNSWVITELEIDEDEQQAIGLHPSSDAVRTTRKRRNYTRDLIRKTVKEDRDNKILALYSEGLSKAQIAREMDLAWNTVAKVISAEEERRAAVAEVQDAEEAVPVAVGSDSSRSTISDEGQDSSISVHNNIVFYSSTSSKVSPYDGHVILSKGSDPPS